MKIMVITLIASTTLAGFSANLLAEEEEVPLFGSLDDVVYSENLWAEMVTQHLVGPGSLLSTPYEGQPPHGAILDTVDTRLTLRGNEGELIIERNYDGEGVSKLTVANDPANYLKAITVMYRRTGYDPENQDWFWVKYKPDGSLDVDPQGMELAGRIAEGTAEGCIACHRTAPGGDYVFNHDRYKRTSNIPGAPD
ncbi:cytochrome P460 family protein [Photobacterium sagamiensis]|uniref:cytochrome P460 family protein n=1 Tax=Photobacterium sagamiensis TaxID=2910241 RepID=UPI003D0ACC9A